MADLLRACDVCLKVDALPRHVFVDLAGRLGGYRLSDEALQGLDVDDETYRRLQVETSDPTLGQRHIDCCARAGCPENICTQEA